MARASSGLAATSRLSPAPRPGREEVGQHETQGRADGARWEAKGSVMSPHVSTSLTTHLAAMTECPGCDKEAESTPGLRQRSPHSVLHDRCTGMARGDSRGGRKASEGQAPSSGSERGVQATPQRWGGGPSGSGWGPGSQAAGRRASVCAQHREQEGTARDPWPGQGGWDAGEASEAGQCAFGLLTGSRRRPSPSLPRPGEHGQGERREGVRPTELLT